MTDESCPSKCIVCKASLVQQYETHKFGERRSLTNGSSVDSIRNVKVGYYCSECGLSYKHPPRGKTREEEANAKV